MLYSEFLKGTGAVDNQSSYDEYKRVEQIYMESDHCTKADAYRMARVETESQREAMMEQQRQKEVAWVMENIIPSAAYIRGMSEKADYFRKNLVYMSPCGNLFELMEVRAINCRSVVLYEFYINGEKVDTSSTGSALLDRAEFHTYQADWHDKTLKELQELFGYIA